jgi:hypothetical protein
MNIIWSGHLVGTFHGYKPGRIYELSDGSKWTQEDLTDEPVYRDDPAARLLSNRSIGAIYLDVEGTSAIVRVYRTGSRPNRPLGLAELELPYEATPSRRPAFRRFGIRRGIPRTRHRYYRRRHADRSDGPEDPGQDQAGRHRRT